MLLRLPFTFLLLFPCLLTPHVLNVETGALHANGSGPPSLWWGGLQRFVWVLVSLVMSLMLQVQ